MEKDVYKRQLHWLEKRIFCMPMRLQCRRSIGSFHLGMRCWYYNQKIPPELSLWGCWTTYFFLSDPGASFLDFFHNSGLFIPFSRRWLVIVIAVSGGDGTWDDICYIICFYAVVWDGKGLLENHTVHVTWGAVSAEAEVSKACLLYTSRCV